MGRPPPACFHYLCASQHGDLGTPARTPLTTAMLKVCSVCSTGYGRGAANQCHICSDSFKGGMFFLLSVAVLLAIGVASLLAVYLVRYLSRECTKFFLFHVSRAHAEVSSTFSPVLLNIFVLSWGIRFESMIAALLRSLRPHHGRKCVHSVIGECPHSFVSNDKVVVTINLGSN